MYLLSLHMFLFLLQSDLLKAKERRYIQGSKADRQAVRKLVAAPPAAVGLSINRAPLDSTTEHSAGCGEMSVNVSVSLRAHLFVFAGKSASLVLQHRGDATICMRCDG